MPSAYFLAAWLLCGTGEHGLGIPAGPPSLAELLEPSREFLPPRPQQPSPPPAPAGWIALGLGYGSLDIDQPDLGDPDEGTIYGGDFGFYRWQGDMGLAVEAGLLASTYETEVDSLTVDEVDSLCWMLGLRAADRGVSPVYVPWLRAGFLYRTDQGSVVDDDGSGFYVGAGLDWRLAGRLSLTPQVLYLDSSSLDSQEWIGSLELTFYL